MTQPDAESAGIESEENARNNGFRRPLASAGATRQKQRVKGIEPSYAAWEAAVLPLNYTRGGGISEFRIAIVDLQTAPDHCHEITSSEPEKMLFPFAPNLPSFPSDHAITPCLSG